MLLPQLPVDSAWRLKEGRQRGDVRRRSEAAGAILGTPGCSRVGVGREGGEGEVGETEAQDTQRGEGGATVAQQHPPPERREKVKRPSAQRGGRLRHQAMEGIKRETEAPDSFPEKEEGEADRGTLEGGGRRNVKGEARSERIRGSEENPKRGGNGIPFIFSQGQFHWKKRRGWGWGSA